MIGTVGVSYAHGGFAKGMPKKLVKVPLVEPIKFFELFDTSMFAEWKL